jgi:phosphoribosylformimino-5-aminoimidazole carboxamide ribotide isomerase
MRKLVELCVPRFIYTDISRDGTLKGPNFAAIERAVKAVKEPVIASGGIASIEHLQRLAEIGVEGAILGRAIYDGTLTLRAALQAVK